MLTREEYIRQSVEINLFFLRIIKEHLIFAAASFTPKDTKLITESINLKMQFEQLLSRTIPLADGLISQEVLSSGEIVTPFTLKAELATQHYTGIPIETRLTRAQTVIRPALNNNIVMGLENHVFMLNEHALKLTCYAISTKKKLYKDVVECKTFTHLYPELLHHVIEEAGYYFEILKKLQRRDDMTITLKKIVEYQVFWNHIMSEHGEFIRGMLDPSEEELIDIADKFADEFDDLFKAAKDASEKAAMEVVTKKSTEETSKFREFKMQGTKGIIDCKIKSVILPLLADHVLRESSHYLRLLKCFKRLEEE
ncbi:UNVERIFIED_CONTAM: protein of unknown function (DUF2935) [Acetivibrio alkalicellulosi]